MSETIVENKSTLRCKQGSWKRFLALFILVILGVGIWSQRIKSSRGFLLDDPHHLEYSYALDLKIFPPLYLPGVPAHRPIGDDAFTLLVRLFGEKDIPIVWTLLLIHVTSTMLIWLSLHRLTSSSLASFAGAAVFLLSEAAYLPIYWPAAIFDLLGTLFVASLLLSVTYIVRPRREYRPWLLMLTIPLLIAAVKTKESMIVVAAPLFLLVFFGCARPIARTGTPVKFVKEIIERFRKLSVWEWAWYGGSILLVLVLALTVQSDFSGAKDVTQPYYSEYSFQVIARSFAYYLGTLMFDSENYQPAMNPLPAVAIMGTLLMGAVLLRNPWICFGWLWFVLFLLPLAALRNHYAYSYYPYTANIGTAFVVAGCFCEWIGAIGRTKWKSTRLLAYAVPVIFVVLVAYQCVLWLTHSSIPRWYDSYHSRSAQVMEALKAALPRPPRYAKIVLVIPEQTQFDTAPAVILSIIYHDFTLDGSLFKEQHQADEYLAVANSRWENAFLAIWNGNAFDVKYVAYH